MTDAPPTPPGAVRIDFRTGVTPLLVGVSVLSGALAALCVLGLARPDVLEGYEENTPATLAVARVVLAVGALLFGAVAVGGALTVRTLRQHAGLLVDHEGIDWWQGHDRVRLATWEDLGAVAVTCRRAPVPTGVGTLVAQRMTGARGWALELWTATAPEHPPHRRLLTVPSEPAPLPGLPPVRRRLYLPPSDALVQQLAEAVAARAPQLWRGTLARA